jgi:hypothetical protein
MSELSDTVASDEQSARTYYEPRVRAIDFSVDKSAAQAIALIH